MEQHNPLVTVGVASYNNAKYIIETLNSIANQTYTNFELIIVDDCSTDESVSLIEQWMKSHPNINSKLVPNSINEGISKTFSKLIKHANGTYITTVGSDDNFLPFKIERFVDAFANLTPDFALVYSDAFLIKPDGSRRYGRFIQRYRQFEDVPAGDIYEELLEGNYIPAMATMIRKSAIEDIGGIDESLSYEDYDLWLRLAQRFKCHFINEETVEYRIHNSSITATKPDFWLESNFEIFAKHFPNPKAIDKYNFYLIQTYYGKKWRIVEKWSDYYKRKLGKKTYIYYFAKFRVHPFLFKIFSRITSL